MDIDSHLALDYNKQPIHDNFLQDSFLIALVSAFKNDEI